MTETDHPFQIFCPPEKKLSSTVKSPTQTKFIYKFWYNIICLSEKNQKKSNKYVLQTLIDIRTTDR